MQKIGIDGHSILGGTGVFAALTLINVNVWISAGAGLATLCYMSLRAAREYVKLRHDLRREKQDEKQDEK